MDVIRSACNGVYVGGLELAVQKPEKEMWIRTESGKGTWQDGWESELREQRLQDKKTKKGRHLGNWKGWEGSDRN